MRATLTFSILALAGMMCMSASAQTTQAPPAAQRPPAANPLANGPQPIEPVNALENAFVAALTDAEMRPVFRRLLLDSQVAVALVPPGGANAAVRMVPIQGGEQAAAIYTSPERLRAILGANAPYVSMTGRAALTRARQGNVALNYMWVPMLTLEPEDITRYLEPPAASAAAPPPQPDQ